MNLAQALVIRAEEAERRNRLEAQFQTWRPTPTRAECNAGGVTLIKEWTLAEIDPLAFDPFEPPGRPDDGRPVVTAPPVITGLARVGDLLTASTGTWLNAPTGFTYQWRRGGYDIEGATDPAYVPRVVDLAWPLSRSCHGGQRHRPGRGARAWRRRLSCPPPRSAFTFLSSPACPRSARC